MSSVLQPEIIIDTCRVGQHNHTMIVGTNSQLPQSLLDRISAEVRNTFVIPPSSVQSVQLKELCFIVQPVTQKDDKTICLEFIIYLSSYEESDEYIIKTFLEQKLSELNKLHHEKSTKYWDKYSHLDGIIKVGFLDRWLSEIQGKVNIKPLENRWMFGVHKKTFLWVALIAIILMFVLIRDKTTIEVNSDVDRSVDQGLQQSAIRTVKDLSQSNSPEANLQIYKDDFFERPTLKCFCTEQCKSSSKITEWFLSLKSQIIIINSIDKAINQSDVEVNQFKAWIKEITKRICSVALLRK
jgi:hypothetical protein